MTRKLTIEQAQNGFADDSVFDADYHTKLQKDGFVDGHLIIEFCFCPLCGGKVYKYEDNRCTECGEVIEPEDCVET